MADLDLDSLRVVDLKKELEKRSLSVSGLKAELKSRLKEALSGEQQNKEGTAESTEKEKPNIAEENPSKNNDKPTIKAESPDQNAEEILIKEEEEETPRKKRKLAKEEEQDNEVSKRHEATSEADAKIKEEPVPENHVDTKEDEKPSGSPSRKRDRDGRNESRRSRSKYRDEKHPSSSRSHRRSSRSRPRSKSPRRDHRDYSSHRDRYRNRSRDRYKDDRDRRGRDRDHDRDRRYRDERRSHRDRSHGRHSSRRDDRHRRSRSHRRDVKPLHLRQREMNLWDQVPPGFENVPASQAKLTGYFPPPGQLVGSRNVASFNPSVLQSQREGEKIDPKKQAMLKQNRRIYVGNIPYGINEDAIAHFFNSTMIDLGIASRDEPPVQSVQINVEKNYAFVEFRNPEQATRGMALDGANFQSQSLKIRRPKDYIPPEGQPEVIQPIHIPGVVSTNVADTPFKIYVGGLPTTLQEDQVIELLSTFGELRSFNLVKDNLTGMSRGFAFCEYLDTNITDVACQGLNGMELGDRRLVVQRASIGARQNNPPPGMNPALGAGPMAPPPLIPAGMSSAGGEPTNILQLLNMVTPEELQDDDEYMDIVEDVKEECSKFGQVIDIRIPRPDSEKEVPGVGKIFVVYPNTQQSGLAHNALAGRKFADRTVLVSYITQENYDNENY